MSATMAKLAGVAAVGVLSYVVYLYKMPSASDELELLRAKTNAQWFAAFEPATGAVAAETWAGTLVDLFSPDYMSAERKPWDTNPKSRRCATIEISISKTSRMLTSRVRSLSPEQLHRSAWRRAPGFRGHGRWLPLGSAL